MKNYVKEYKGNKVPEGATHVSAFPTLQPIEFYRVIGGTYQFFNTGTVNPAWCKSVFNEANEWSIELPEAPQEWMPNVGEECVVSYPYEDGNFKCFDGEEVLIISCGRCEMTSEYVYTGHSTKHGYVALSAKGYRPLKTEEEKKREAFIEGVKQLFPKSDTDDLIFAGKLFDAGFTAPKAANNDQK